MRRNRGSSSEFMGAIQLRMAAGTLLIDQAGAQQTTGPEPCMVPAPEAVLMPVRALIRRAQTNTKSWLVRLET
ncbi:hypothetical protein UNPA324_22375 [Bradyrhizobium sp. UNPA324]|nr:hypothetical protein UNPA324_22375 [Bradyrhizobium sp. UNPA324]